MGRILIQYLLPLLGPLVLYLLYMAYRRRHAAKHGNDVPEIERSHVFWSIIVGFVLMMAGLVSLAVFTGEEPGSGQYQSPRMEDGRVVPPSSSDPRATLRPWYRSTPHLIRKASWGRNPG